MIRPRHIVVSGCLTIASWGLWMGNQPWLGDQDQQFTWLAKQDAALLEDQRDPSRWEVIWLGPRRALLDRAYRRFLRRHPRHDRALVAYGCFLYDQHEEAKAVELWEASAKANPNLAVAYNNLAQHFIDNGDVERALPLYELAIKLDPNGAVYHFNWATACSLYRNETKAVYGWNTTEIMQRSLEAYRRARDLTPHDVGYGTAYAETFACLPEPDWLGAYEAWKFCAEQTQSKLEQQRMCGRVARTCLRLQRYAEAEKWLDQMDRPELVTMRAALQRKRVALMSGVPDTQLPAMRAKADVAP